MPQPVVIEYAAACCALGMLDQAAQALMDGRCGVAARPCFGVPVAWAPFADNSLRDIVSCARKLADGMPAPPPGPALFIFCAAKGDLRRLDREAAGEDLSGTPPVLLSAQAEAAREAFPGLFERTMVISNACASGTIALEVAAGLLREGAFSRAVVFGYDSVSRFVATGFHALGALSPDPARPFDRNRNGLSLGDGAGLAMLSCRKPVRGDLCIAGAGSSNDANHRTGPSRTGDGLARAARAALQDAGMGPEAVGAVKCHGTATVYNDAMEAKALHLVFGDRVPPCVSVKGALGHTSGAGSLLEALLASRFLKRRSLPPTAGFSALGVDEPVPVSGSAQRFAAPSVLCLSAGFGGVNAGLVLTEAA